MNLALPAQALNELKTLYQKHCGLDLSDAEAAEEAAVLLNLYALSQGKQIK